MSFYSSITPFSKQNKLQKSSQDLEPLGSVLTSQQFSAQKSPSEFKIDDTQHLRLKQQNINDPAEKQLFNNNIDCDKKISNSHAQNFNMANQQQAHDSNKKAFKSSSMRNLLHKNSLEGQQDNGKILGSKNKNNLAKLNNSSRDQSQQQILTLKQKLKMSSFDDQGGKILAQSSNLHHPFNDNENVYQLASQCGRLFNCKQVQNIGKKNNNLLDTNANLTTKKTSRSSSFQKKSQQSRPNMLPPPQTGGSNKVAQNVCRFRQKQHSSLDEYLGSILVHQAQSLQINSAVSSS